MVFYKLSANRFHGQGQLQVFPYLQRVERHPKIEAWRAGPPKPISQSSILETMERLPFSYLSTGSAALWSAKSARHFPFATDPERLFHASITSEPHTRSSRLWIDLQYWLSHSFALSVPTDFGFS
jgi:hypothetical protein